jgi:hypothetical protein
MCFRTGPVRQEGAHNSRRVAAPAHSLPVALLFRSPSGSFTLRFVHLPGAPVRPVGMTLPELRDTAPVTGPTPART